MKYVSKADAHPAASTPMAYLNFNEQKAGKLMIYADYAATSGLISEQVIEAVAECMKNPGNAGRGSHEAALGAGRIIYETRERTAHFFDAYGAENVAFTSGITMSLNMAIKGLISKGDHVISTYAEHNSVLRPLYEMMKRGVSVSFTTPDLSHIASKIQGNTKAVIMTCASNVTGDIYDFSSIGKFCRERGILFIADTAQYVGENRISMKKDNIDVLCFTAHKGLMGPQGIGGICVRDKISVRPLLTGGSGVMSFSKEQPEEMPVLLEAGTLNTPGIAGLNAALKKLSETEEKNKSVKLAKRFYEGIRDIKNIRFYGDYTDWNKRTAIVALNIDDYDSSAVSDELSERFGIETRAGAHCAPLMHEHLGTVTQGIVRFSFGMGNTETEIDECINAIKILATE